MSDCTLRLKQGATLALDLFVTDDQGAAVNLQSATVLLLVCDLYGNLLSSVTPARSAEQGWATVVEATGTWPIGVAVAELQVTVGGLTEISDSFPITVERPVGQ